MVGTILQGDQFIIRGLNGCERMFFPACCEFFYTFQIMENQDKIATMNFGSFQIDSWKVRVDRLSNLI